MGNTGPHLLSALMSAPLPHACIAHSNWKPALPWRMATNIMSSNLCCDEYRGRCRRLKQVAAVGTASVAEGKRERREARQGIRPRTRVDAPSPATSVKPDPPCSAARFCATMERVNEMAPQPHDVR